jgi:hypothetical protein
MMFYSTITKVVRAKVERDAKRINLIAVILFVAGGLLLTAAFFAAGFGADIGQILAGP